jgi:hypothetical protein
MEASRKKYNIYKIHIDGIYFITLASLNFLKIQTKAGSQQGRIGIATNFKYSTTITTTASATILCIK